MAVHYRIRRMRREDVEVAVEWAYEEGWNPGLYDAGVFYQTDPSGFWAGTIDGEIISTMSGVRYDPGYGFLGFFITHPDYRGRGYGSRLWETVHEQMETDVLGLDGAPAQQAFYKRAGYRPSHRNIRHEGVSEHFSDLDPHIVNVTHIPFDRLDMYDRRRFGARRTRFLRGWISRPGTHALTCFKDGDVCGYGVVRPCREGFKIGPLFADSEPVAEMLYRALVTRVHPDEPVFLDIPEPNPAAFRLADRHRMKPVFETVRMYRNGTLEAPLNNWFGVTSFELG
ncbi:MAG: hypothetical protein MAG453_00399 [Calditrichaeota bacterium]|nr:hypothetical protein [Calditrichota bacterium]